MLSQSLYRPATTTHNGAVDTTEVESWQRGERVIAHLSQRRARYPSVTWCTDGRPLILFTRQSQQQEQSGTGDLCVLRRTTDDQWWHVPQVVHRGDKTEPRAYGTMTTLTSGRIIAPFFEAGARGPGFKLLASDDNGNSWRVQGPVAVDTLVWAAPYSRHSNLPASW